MRQHIGQKMSHATIPLYFSTTKITKSTKGVAAEFLARESPRKLKVQYSWRFEGEMGAVKHNEVCRI